MARSSHSKGSVSVDLFNLPTLPDERRVATSYLDHSCQLLLARRGKTPRLAKLLAGNHLTDKLQMVMRDLSLRSSISEGRLVQKPI